MPWQDHAVPVAAGHGGTPRARHAAHAKNFSVLHDRDSPAIRLAPLYDVLSTIALDLTDKQAERIRDN
jgi:hypothetical protein